MATFENLIRRARHSWFRVLLLSDRFPGVGASTAVESAIEVSGWVLGCHRSGTSLLCSIVRGLAGVSRAGVLGLDVPANLENPAGFHESAALLEVNKRLLDSAGCTWDRPFVARPAWSAPESRRLILRLREAMRRHTTEVGWIDKDPRLCLTRDAFPHLLLADPAAIAVVRNPLAVADSLFKRNGFSLRKAAAIWMLYNLHLFNSHCRPPEAIIVFDDLLSDDEPTQLKIAGSLASFYAKASDGMLTDTSSASLEERALHRLRRMRRIDLVRSDNHFHGQDDRSFVATLDDIWLGCREIVHGGKEHQMAAYMRDAWASVSPVLEAEVAIPLRDPRISRMETSTTVQALRRRAAALVPTGQVRRRNANPRLPGNESPSTQPHSPTSLG